MVPLQIEEARRAVAIAFEREAPGRPSLYATTKCPLDSRIMSNPLPGFGIAPSGPNHQANPPIDTACHVKPAPAVLRVSAYSDPSDRCTTAGCRFPESKVNCGDRLRKRGRRYQP